MEKVLSSDEAESLRRDWTRFTALTFLFSFGFAVYMGVFQNFLKDVLDAGPIQLGGLESLREIPGLLTAILTGTLAALAESRVAGLGLLITGIGIGATGLASGFGFLIGVTIFWSVGFHLYAGMANAITLMLSKGEESGKHLGRMNAVSSIATLVGLSGAWLAKWLIPNVPYNAFFFVAGGAIFSAGILCMMLGKHASSAEPRAPLILRKEYSLFYLLTFLEGCRRQIFSIFASFALILVYHVPLIHMLMLQLVNAILIAVTAPHIGKMVDRHGERKPLIFYAIGLIVVFLGYALLRTVGALYALFLLDNILFSFGVGFTTYLNRIVRPGELTPCVAMGTTMNHIAAVTVPIGGALLWENLHNYQAPFWVGVAIACISLLATFRLPHGPIPRRTEKAA